MPVTLLGCLAGLNRVKTNICVIKQFCHSAYSTSYAVTDRAWRTLRDMSTDQCVLISGESGSGSSSTYGSPTREIPSIRSTKNYRGVGSRVSHSFSVPLNLFSLVRNNPSVETYPSTNLNGRPNGEVGINDLSPAE